MLLALDICVNRKAPTTHSEHWGLNPTSKTSNPFLFAKAPFKSSNHPSPPF